MAGFRIEGNTSGNVVEVDADNNIKVVTSNNPLYMGGFRNFSENDTGLAVGGVPLLSSPEVDTDYRLRVATDLSLDEEDLVYTAQNFTKHALHINTYVPAFTLLGINFNSTNITTGNSAASFRTYKTFSLDGTETVSLDVEAAISAVIPVNTTIEFGFGLAATTAPYAIFDGVFIRADSTGLQGVVRNNSTSDISTTSLFTDTSGVLFQPTPAVKYQYIVYLSNREVQFWIRDPISAEIWLAGILQTPSGYGSPMASPATQVIFKQNNSASAPATATSLSVSRYHVRRGGLALATTVGEQSARTSESIYSAGTLTTTAAQTITAGSITRPVGQVPNNTTSTLASLAGIYVENGTLALGTDAILMSYQVPALPVAPGTTFLQNRRLRIDGVSVTSGVTTAFATGGFSKFFYIAYGSTALSLTGVTADTVTTKACRRVPTSIVQHYTATHAPGAPNFASASYHKFNTPLYVNPGEFIALITYHQGVVGTVGVITHALSFDYSWE